MNAHGTPYIKISEINLAPLKRKRDANKGTHGSLAIIGGQDGMVGALLLASRTAILSGTGRVYAFSLSNQPLTVDVTFPEVMHRHLSDLPQLAQNFDAFVIGPGFGKQLPAIEWLKFCLNQPKPIVVDADALNLIAEHPEFTALVNHRNHATIFTPHPGEAARLLNQTVSSIQHDRIQAALKLAKYFKCMCVLKGAESVCSSSNGEYWINPTGNPGLASAGTGDVLSGFVGALLAQGLPTFDALKCGVYIHGLAADKLVEKGIGPIGLTASEVAIEIRQLLNTTAQTNL